MATNSAAQLCIQNTDSILLYTVTIWGGGEETLPKICKLYLYLMYRFFTWTGFGKLIEFQVTFFQSVYIWLIQTKLVLSDNRATKFHQSHSAVLEMKHANKWTLHAHYTFFFPWILRVYKCEIMYKIQVKKINSLTSAANNNTMAGPIWDVLN